MIDAKAPNGTPKATHRILLFESILLYGRKDVNVQLDIPIEKPTDDEGSSGTLSTGSELSHLAHWGQTPLAHRGHSLWAFILLDNVHITMYTFIEG